MHPEARPRHSPRILWREGEDSVLLLNPDDGQYFALEEPGSRIWGLCDGSRSIAEIAAVLEQEYDAPAETIRADVLELVAALADEKLLEAP